MKIGEIVREGEREVPGWEPSREAPEPAPAPEKTEPEKVSAPQAMFYLFFSPPASCSLLVPIRGEAQTLLTT